MGIRSLLRRVRGRQQACADRWDGFVETIDAESLGLVPLEADAKRALFKRNVRLVELEPHAYCNRICSFCPNATIDRRGVRTRMQPAVFARVLAELRGIEYSGVLRFARYSEPMADDHIFELVAAARRELPKANIDVVTNGDYLRPESLPRLRAAGLSVLRVSVYLREGTPWSAAGAKAEIERLGRRIGTPPTFHADSADTVGASFRFEGLEVVAWSHDFDRIGYDRGESLPALVDSVYVRRSPCSMVFYNFTVDFDGKVMPCCNLRGDHQAHKEFVLGDLSRGDGLFDVYASPAFAGWRRELAGVSDKRFPCKACKQKTAEGEALVQLGRSVERKLREIGPS